jgi:hypothetical protein
MSYKLQQKGKSRRSFRRERGAMKSKGSSSLYEVLKGASRSQGREADAAPSPESQEGATLQDRLVAYKAAKFSGSVMASPASDPPVAPVCVEPSPPPVSGFDSVPVKGPGDRVIRITYNTALFGSLILAGLLFISYAVGMHAVGRTVEEVPAPKRTPVLESVSAAPVPLPVVKKEYTLRLAEWKYGTSRERLNATAQADELKRAVERAGHRSVEKELIKRGGEPRLALYLDKFADLSSEAAKSKLVAMKGFKHKGTLPFDQATFEELLPK